MKCVHQNNAPKTTSVGHHHIGALPNFGKLKICRKHRTFGTIG